MRHCSSSVSSLFKQSQMIISEHDKSDYFKSPSEMVMKLCLNSDTIELGGCMTFLFINIVSVLSEL